MLKCWQANIDIQCGLDPYACVSYIASLLTKERSLKSSISSLPRGKISWQWYQVTGQKNKQSVFEPCWSWCSGGLLFGSNNAIKKVIKGNCICWYKYPRKHQIWSCCRRILLTLKVIALWNHTCLKFAMQTLYLGLMC